MIDTDVVIEIENELRVPCFYDIPVGNTLGDVLYIEFIMGNGKWSKWEFVKNFFRLIYHSIVPPTRNNVCYNGVKNRILFTWQDERETLKDMVCPVINQFRPEQVTVVGKSLSMKKHLAKEIVFSTWTQMPALNIFKWRKEFSKCILPWTRKILALYKKNRLPLVAIPRLIDALIVQTQKIMMFDNFLDQIQPSAVVTEYDRNINASCLILTARSKNIPTMTMIHGVINSSSGYWPLLADTAFCWGEQHRQQFIQFGCRSDRLVVTGCQRFSQSLAANRDDALKKLSLPVSSTVVLFASNPIEVNLRRKLVQDFCSALSSNSSFLGVVRLHPSEKLAFYEKEMKMFPEVRFLANSDWTLDEAIAASNVVVVHESGFGNDALIKGKPVVIYHPFSISLGTSSKLLVEIARCPLAINSNELSDAVWKILNDVDYRTELSDKARSYVNYFCKYFGDIATSNIASEIKARATL